MSHWNQTKRRYGPAALCRMDDGLVQTIADDKNSYHIIAACCLAILLGTVCYGAVFGFWRAPMQALYSAIKMPILIYSVTVSSAIINSMLAQVLGSKLSFRQTCICILLSFAIASVLLGALSPILLFFVIQGPSPGSGSAKSVYTVLLVVNTALVGLCGIIANIRLYRLLKALTSSQAIATRVLTSWILVSGFVGCQLSWIISPFLAKPGVAIPFLNPDAFNGNFFEYLWQAIRGLM